MQNINSVDSVLRMFGGKNVMGFVFRISDMRTFRKFDEKSPHRS